MLWCMDSLVTWLTGDDWPPPPPAMPSPMDPLGPHPIAAAAMDHLRQTGRELLAQLTAAGKMIGVLVVADAGGRLGYLRAFSGSIDGFWRIPGWAPPLFDESRQAELLTAGEPTLDRLTEALRWMESADLSASWAELQRTHAEERRALCNAHAGRRMARRTERGQGVSAIRAHDLDQQSRADAAERRQLRTIQGLHSASPMVAAERWSRRYRAALECASQRPNTMNTLNKNQPTVYAGLDISKATLQLHLQNKHHVLDNHPKGHALLVKKLRALGGVQVICEATGGYEKGVVAALHDARQLVSLLNPARVRHFALALGQRAKNDPIDSTVLTAYGQAMRPEPTPPVEPARQALRALVQWRDHLKDQLTRARQTTEHGLPAWIAGQQKKLVAHLEKQMARVEKECQQALARTPELQAQVRVLEQLDAVGTITALSVLSHLPELGTLNRQEAAALAGLAPWVRQSGPWEGQRHIGGGRAAVRRALYMSAVGLARMKESTLGKFYARLRAAGKPAKVALTAVMRKLLLQMNRVLQAHALEKQKPQPA